MIFLFRRPSLLFFFLLIYNSLSAQDTINNEYLNQLKTGYESLNEDDKDDFIIKHFYDSISTKTYHEFVLSIKDIEDLPPSLKLYNILLNINKINGNSYLEKVYHKKLINTAIDSLKWDIVAEQQAWLAYKYSVSGDLKPAMKNITEALRNNEKHNSVKAEFMTYLLAGYVYKNMGRYDKGKMYFDECLKLPYKTHYKASALNEIGNYYIMQNPPEYDKAIKYKKLAIEKQLKENPSSALYTYMDLSVTFNRMEQYDSARYYLNLCTNIKGYKNNNEIQFFRNINYSNSYIRDRDTLSGKYIINTQNQKDSIYYYLKKAKKNAEQLNKKSYYSRIYVALNFYYYAIGDYKNAYENYYLYSLYNDSISSENILKQVNELNTKYETELKDKELLKQDLQIKRQRILIVSIILILITIIIASVWLYKLNKRLKLSKIQLEQKTEEIQMQAESLEESNKLITYKNQQITSSINYAQRIQNAVLPDNNFLNNDAFSGFIIYQPKDIVSGDFYWYKEINNIIYFAVADCTGHGVPGAFVSMLGITLLNEIILKQNINKTNIILDTLRDEIKQTLRQTEDNQEQKDGMDIAFCCIDKNTKQLSYSGANIHLVLIRDNELIEYKANRQPIGVYVKEQPFTKNEIELHKDDMLYLYSDGYVSQFSENNREKFKSKRLKNELLQIHKNKLSEQRQYLIKTMNNWKGNSEQIDDITLLGITIL